MPRIWAPWIVRRMLLGGLSVGASARGRVGVSCSIKVRIVWSGNSGSQDSIHCGVGSNVPFVEYPAAE
jgi:hypothetical protein